MKLLNMSKVTQNEAPLRLPIMACFFAPHSSHGGPRGAVGDSLHANRSVRHDRQRTALNVSTHRMLTKHP